MTTDYRTGVTQFLLDHAGSEPVSFHMPGHKGSQLYRNYGYSKFLDAIMDCDITEISGADNLFSCTGVLGETADMYAKLYNVRKTYLLVNGTSGGIIASILATVPAGGSILMSRNCHKSVYNALRLGNITPTYVYPQIVPEYGISGPVSPEAVLKGFEANPDAAAFVLPSPNYYGICSDIKAIAQVCHSLGKILIVDQAHGAHLKMMERVSDLPMSAETAGADLIINSTHKTLASCTQSAVLNINSHRVDLSEIEDRLQMIESSSPSYILMASLDVNAHIISEHPEVFKEWNEAVACFYDQVASIPGLKTMDVPGYLDITKLNIDMSAYGLNGQALAELLECNGIHPELVTGNLVMCMTGIGTSRNHVDRLVMVLQDYAKNHELVAESCEMLCENSELIWDKRRVVHEITSGFEMKHIAECVGRISAGTIIPYPPGIPLVCPGETIDEEDVQYVSELMDKGRDVIGLDIDKCVRVVKE